MILADAWAKRTDAQKLQRSNERIKELQTKLDHQTLRPKVGGVYAQREMSPMLPAANGGSNGQNASSVPPSGGSARIPDGDNAWFGRGLSTKSALDDRRKVDNQDIKTHPGVMVLDNPNLPFDIYVPTLDGDEALTFNELPGLLAAGAATAGVHAVRGARGMYNLFADPHSGKRPKMAGGRVKSPKKNSAGKRPFQP
ncbi:hypothetical protein JC607_04660 [Paracoccus sp. IB05]|nr:hypothetical protein [Paracoccus sp. IB05]